MKDSQQHAPLQFGVKPGERITACFPLFTTGSDRMLQEVANCNYCLHPTYRIVVMTTPEGWERRTALCARHFVDASRVFPELKRLLA